MDPFRPQWTYLGPHWTLLDLNGLVLDLIGPYLTSKDLSWTSLDAIRPQWTLLSQQQQQLQISPPETPQLAIFDNVREHMEQTSLMLRQLAEHDQRQALVVASSAAAAAAPPPAVDVHNMQMLTNLRHGLAAIAQVINALPGEFGRTVEQASAAASERAARTVRAN